MQQGVKVHHVAFALCDDRTGSDFEPASSADGGEPGVTHMRDALRRGIPVVTSNKWPVALNGVELAELARVKEVPFGAESTVISGTPVLSTLVDGLAGTTPISLRGILSATANLILTRMEQGASYQDALTEAQDLGLPECSGMSLERHALE